MNAFDVGLELFFVRIKHCSETVLLLLLSWLFFEVRSCGLNLIGHVVIQMSGTRDKPCTWRLASSQARSIAQRLFNNASWFSGSSSMIRLRTIQQSEHCYIYLSLINIYLIYVCTTYSQNATYNNCEYWDIYFYIELINKKPSCR